MQIVPSTIDGHSEPLPTAEALGARDEIDDIEARSTPGTLNIGTRASRLAMVQAELVRAALAREHPGCKLELAPMTTAGDKNQSQALYLMGGKALWTQELEVALLEGAVDLIVHSLKDMPTALPEGCEVGAILEREDPRDALVVKRGLPYVRLEDMPAGAIVGTSSVRRVAQLRRAFPHLVFADVRGNLNTRLAKLDDPQGPFSAIILAAAGLMRLGMADRITSTLGSPNMLYAVGQGALGIEVRSRDPTIQLLVRRLEHWQTTWRTLAEREMLRLLEGGCSVPVGCESSLEELDMPPTPHPNGTIDSSTVSAAVAASRPPRAARLTLSACITSLSGAQYVYASATHTCHSPADAEALGRHIAQNLIDQGGRTILEELGRKTAGADFAQKHQAAVAHAVERSKLGVSPTASDCG